jgi:hypothetical protein
MDSFTSYHPTQYCLAVTALGKNPRLLVPLQELWVDVPVLYVSAGLHDCFRQELRKLSNIGRITSATLHCA